MSNLVSSEKGIALLLGVLFVAILTMLAALVLGIGMVASSKSRIQNTANLVALGVLENITKNGNAGGAVNRANEIAASNKIPGAKAISDIRDTASGGRGGRIEYGMWYQSPPGVPNESCEVNGLESPCFVPTGYTPNVNAVRVEVRNEHGTNPIIAPFAGYLGYDGGYVSTSATSVLAGQCTAVIMDVSLSTTYDTHTIKLPPTAPLPPNRSLFVYPSSFSCPPTPGNLIEETFCSMNATRSGPVNPQVHFQNDYQVRSSNLGLNSVLVDTFVDNVGTVDYEGPEPFRSLFLGVNSAMRSIFEGSAGSLWRGIGFEHGLTDAVTTNTWVPNAGFATNPGILVQATNIDNRGTNGAGGNPIISTVRTPNFLDFGWYPRIWLTNPNPQEEKTNIIEAFEAAINVLQDQTLSASCPPFFKKSIILATDGIGNCFKAGDGTYNCKNDFEYFQRYRDQILGAVSNEIDRKDIAVIILFAGEKVGPHFINRAAPAEFVTSTGSQFMNITEAIANGYGGILSDNKLFDESPSVRPSYTGWCNSENCPFATGAAECSISVECRNDYAMQFPELPENVFRLPGAVLAQLAIDSGGTFCPLLPLHPNPTAYIDHDGDPTTPKVLDDAFRSANERQEFAITEITPAEQAVECLKANWRNQYILVEQEG